MCANERVLFSSKEICREFFEKCRESLGFRNWNEMHSSLGMCRSQFQRYLYAERTMPVELFEKLSANLDAEERARFSGLVDFRDKNWGARKGGIATAGLHPEIFAEGRAKLAANLKRLALKNCYLGLPLTKELCELIGAYIGDGSNGKYGRHYDFQIAGHKVLDKEYLEYLSRTLKYLFAGIKVRSWVSKDCEGRRLIVNSRHIFELLTKRFGFPAGPKSHTVRIPDEILNEGDEFVFPTIRGIFDTDGCVFFDKRSAYLKPYPRITITLASFPLHSQLKEILSKHFPLYTYFRKSRNCYYLEIYGSKNLGKWMKLIGFSNKKHLNKIPNKPLAGIEPTTPTLPMSCSKPN